MSTSLPVAPLRVNSLGVVTSSRFLNSGTHLTGNRLGFINGGTSWVNAVELQFWMDASMAATYTGIHPRQWIGPDVVWVKHGSPLTAPWQTHSAHPNGGGQDAIDPLHIITRSDVVAFYDNPGPHILMFPRPPYPSRIHAVQNFTAWIVGTDASGTRRKLSNVLAWHSIVSLGNQNAAHPNQAPSYISVFGTRSGTGWVSTATPPPV